MAKKELAFIDLFCGIGGFRRALEKKGLTCVFSSDIDKDAQQAYARNFGEKPHGDITQVATEKIPKHDILCAGFPCQPFSISGKRNGLEDHNGKLFYEIIRIAKYHQPAILLLENVKNILSINNGKVMEDINKALDEIGYTMHAHMLNASLFGIPQARKRVYFVCLRKDLENEHKLTYAKPTPINKKIFLCDILEDNADEKLYINRKDLVLYDAPIAHQLKPIRVGHVNKGGQGERVYSPTGHAITLSAFGGGVGARTGLYRTNKGVRRLSISECKSLMGFPKDHYTSPGLKGYQQLGNAVIPQMISHVYDAIKCLT